MRYDRILIAGGGGGFDVYAGLPLATALRRAGKQVFLANLTFTYLGETRDRAIGKKILTGSIGAFTLAKPCRSSAK